MDWTIEATALLDKLTAMFAASPAHVAVLQNKRALFITAFEQKLAGGWVPKSGYLTIAATPVLSLPEITSLMREAYGRYRASAA